MKRPTQKSPAALQQQVDRWNGRYPVGAPVSLVKDDGTAVVTKTRSAASILSGHTAVIWVDGVSGCYLLDRVHPLVGAAG